MLQKFLPLMEGKKRYHCCTIPSFYMDYINKSILEKKITDMIFLFKVFIYMYVYIYIHI